MAVTSGHGNPKWTREEIILALDLYIECAGELPGPHDQRVKKLSDLLRALPHHAIAARKTSFRNPDGVAFKLQNIRKIATGTGLSNFSLADKEVWNELGNRPHEVKRLADLIRGCLNAAGDVVTTESDAEVFYEGRTVTETHLRRERSPKARDLLLKNRVAGGRLACEMCGCDPSIYPESFQNSIFEAHHKLPLAAGLERETQVMDLALLCANCHRLIHRAIAKTKKWLTVEETKKLLWGDEAMPRPALHHELK